MRPVLSRDVSVVMVYAYTTCILFYLLYLIVLYNLRFQFSHFPDY